MLVNRSGSGTMQARAFLLTAALVLGALGTRATDLVIRWEKEFYPGEG
jgi:hypothetical protein